MSTPPPAVAPAPRRTSLAGPVVLTVVGALLLVGALAVAVATAGAFVGAVRSDVVALDGSGPGDAVLASADAPGVTSVELTAGERYAVYLVVPRETVGDDERPDLEDDVLLRTPSGAVVAADGSPGVNVTTSVRGWTAATVGAFTAPETGTYDVAAPDAGVPDAWVALAPDKPFAPFFGAIWGTVAGVFVVIGLSVVGVGVLAGGIVWWVLRARARRTASTPV